MRRALATAVGVVAVVLGPGAGAAWADFVCPVVPVSDQAKEHSDQFITIAGGDTSLLPGKAGDSAASPVNVPDQATNQNGTGSPMGAHARPGDAGYSPIWNTP